MNSFEKEVEKMDIGVQGQAVAGSAAAGVTVLKKALDTQERVAKTLLEEALDPPEQGAPSHQTSHKRGQSLDVTV